jgi:sulfur carrier protein ThiS
MMATVSTDQRSIEVTLIRADADSQTFTLPEGATLGDLLREAGAPIRRPRFLIDGDPIEDATILRSGMTITLIPEPSEAGEKRSWLEAVGMFADDPTFGEAVAEGRAIREADRRAAREDADPEDS